MMRKNLFALAFALLSLASGNALPEDKVAKFVSAAKEQAARDLIDPSSAQFRDLEVREWVGAENKKHLALCGQINAKNRMGGYVGFRIFSASEKSATIYSEEMMSFEKIFYDVMCGTEARLVRKVK